MDKKAYAIWDKKSETFSFPVVHQHNVEAIRELEYVVNDVSRPTMLSRYPDEFELYYMGEFDSRTGRIDQLKHPELVCAVGNLIRKKQEEKNEIPNIA